MSKALLASAALVAAVRVRECVRVCMHAWPGSGSPGPRSSPVPAALLPLPFAEAIARVAGLHAAPFPASRLTLLGLHSRVASLQALPASAFTGSLSGLPLRANARATASQAAVTMVADSEGHAMRRAIIRSGVVAASTAFLAQVPALAAGVWEEFEDDGDCPPPRPARRTQFLVGVDSSRPREEGAGDRGQAAAVKRLQSDIPAHMLVRGADEPAGPGADGTSVWVNSETGEESKTDPSKKKAKKAKKEKAAEPAAAEDAQVAAADKKDGGMPKVSKVSGQVTKFKDINKGFQILKPIGWNQFDTAPGEYDVKWEDLVEKSELIMVGSSPVKSATSVDALGDIQAVGASLAKKKKAKLIDAKENNKDGILYYTFVFKAGDDKAGAREVYQLCVSKGKLWSVTATTAEKRWEKRKDLYGSIMASFAPKL